MSDDKDMSSGNCKKDEDTVGKQQSSSSASLLDSLSSDELLSHVFSWLTPLELLQSVCLVSKRFALQVLQDDDGDTESSFWRTSLSVPKNEITQRFTRHQLQRYCMFETARKSIISSSTMLKDSDFAAKVPECLKYGSMLVFKSQIRGLVGNRVCLASTTDHQGNESLENVLPENGEDDETERFYATMHPLQRQQIAPHIMGGGPVGGEFLVRIHAPNLAAAPRWWSSRPRPSSSGTLLFTMRYPECLISEVWIKPLRDPYVAYPVYSWKQTKIQAFRLPLRILGKTRHEIARQDNPRTAKAAAAASSSTSTSSSSLNVQQQYYTVDNDIDMTTNDLQQQQQQPQQPIPLLSGSWQQRPSGLLSYVGRPHSHGRVEDFDWALYHANSATTGIVQISRQRFLPPEGPDAGPIQAPPGDEIIQDLLVNGQVPVYESLAMPHPHHHHHSAAADSSKLLKFALPPGVVANVIVVTLIGKNHEQIEGSGYYACVERVDCRGIPLYPHQSVLSNFERFIN